MRWQEIRGIGYLRRQGARGAGHLRRRLAERDESGAKLRTLAEQALRGRPLAVVDVGARWGLLPELQPIESFVSVVGFDPDADECERLNIAARERGLRQRFLPYLVAGADERRTFHRTRKAASSSLLEPNRALYDDFPDAGADGCRRSRRSRDSCVWAAAYRRANRGRVPQARRTGHRGRDPRLARRGAASRPPRRPRRGAVRAAVPGQCGFADVDTRLKAAGFELYELKRYSWRRRTFDSTHYRSRGQVAFADALYLRDLHGLSHEQRRRLAVVAALFRHIDLAHELVADDRALAEAVTALAPSQGARGPWSSDADDWL